MKPHRISGVSAFTTLARLSSMANETGLAASLGSRPAMDVPGRIGAALILRLAVQFRGIGEVFVDRARDHVEIQPLGALRRVDT